MEKDIMSLRVGSGLPNIQGKVLLDLPICFIDNFDMQNQLASIFISMDNDIIYLESKKAKYESIKQGK